MKYLFIFIAAFSIIVAAITSFAQLSRNFCPGTSSLCQPIPSGAATVTQNDDFVDSGTPINIQSHTPLIGSWSFVSGTTNAVSIQTSGTLNVGTGANSDTFIKAADTPLTDQVLEVTDSIPFSGAVEWSALLRAVDVNNGIVVLFDYYNTIETGDRVGGTTTITGNCGPPISGHVYKVEVTGTTVTVKDNGTLQSGCTYTTSYTTGTHIGIYAMSISGGGSMTHWKSGSGF